MIDKKLFRPSTIQRWIVVIYERPQRFSSGAADDMVQGLRSATTAMGITGFATQPKIVWENPQADVIGVCTVYFVLPFFISTRADQFIIIIYTRTYIYIDDTFPLCSDRPFAGTEWKCVKLPAGYRTFTLSSCQMDPPIPINRLSSTFTFYFFIPSNWLLIICTFASFSDCQVGVATQCMRSAKCFRAKPQYYANVCLKYVSFLPSFFHTLNSHDSQN
jgi:eukaryotic translation initiation factor 2C